MNKTLQNSAPRNDADAAGEVVPRLPSAPFFELGLKNYVYGDDVLRIAIVADALAVRHDVDILLIAPYADIRRIADRVERLLLVAPYMDVLRPGPGLADVLPESLRAAGAHGVVVNHSERPMPIAQVAETISRARELGMFTFACADSIDQARAIACLGPDIVNPEPAELIGGAVSAGVPFLRESEAAVRGVAPGVLVEQAAGITSPQEVYDLVLAGADGVGVASGVMRAEDPERQLTEMVEALVHARDARTRAQEEKGTTA